MNDLLSIQVQEKIETDQDDNECINYYLKIIYKNCYIKKSDNQMKSKRKVSYKTQFIILKQLNLGIYERKD